MGHKFYIDLSRAEPDEQRSFAMLKRNKSWGKFVKEVSGIREATMPIEPVKTRPTAPKAATAKSKWEEVKAGWEATRASGELTCRCGRIYAALGSPESGGALFHKAWTVKVNDYGKGETKAHYIDAIK